MAVSPSLKSLFDLTGRTALVTGGAGLLGSQISEALAEQGARVIIASRDAAKCETFAASLRDRFGGQHQGIALDLMKSDSVQTCIDLVGAGGGVAHPRQLLVVGQQEHAGIDQRGRLDLRH